VKEFKFLLIHVLHVSYPAALEGSTRYAREIVDRFFSEHTQIDVGHIELHNHKFRNLVAESRLEIAFAGWPKKFKVLNYKIYKYEHSEGLSVVFEVEIRLIKRYIPPNCDFEILEMEPIICPFLDAHSAGSRHEGIIHEYVRRQGQIT